MSLANLINELNPQQKQKAEQREAQHSLGFGRAGCGKNQNHRGASNFT